MTELRCRPGDLAVVVWAPSTPETLGRFVIVERRVQDGEVMENGMQVRTFGLAGWLVRSAADGVKLPARGSLGGLTYLRRRGMADLSLFPIRPDDGVRHVLKAPQPHVEIAP